MKRGFYLLAILVLLFTETVQPAWAANPVTPDINLNQSRIAAQAHVEGGYVYLPVRAICEALGYAVSWSEEKQTAGISAKGKSISLNLKESNIVAKDHTYYMKYQPILIQDRIYMQEELFSDHFALKVQRDQKNGTVWLDSVKENAISVKTIKVSSESSMLKITLQYPQLDGLENKLVQDGINALFKQAADNSAKEGNKNADDLAQFNKEHGDGSPNPCEAYLNYQLKYNRNNILSLVFQDYQYAGGAHGNTLQTSYTINLKNGDQYSLKDLFQENADYVSICSDTVKTQLNERNLTAALFKPFDKISDRQYYYLSNSGVTVYFQQYDILPYSEGIQEFPVEFSLLGNLFKNPAMVAAEL
jgi:hypothetical protein